MSSKNYCNPKHNLMTLIEHRSINFAISTGIINPDKTFTIWNLKTGEIKQQIFDDSPIKIISNDYLILIYQYLWKVESTKTFMKIISLNVYVRK